MYIGKTEADLHKTLKILCGHQKCNLYLHVFFCSCNKISVLNFLRVVIRLSYYQRIYSSLFFVILYLNFCLIVLLPISFLLFCYLFIVVDILIFLVCSHLSKQNQTFQRNMQMHYIGPYLVLQYPQVQELDPSVWRLAWA